MTEELPIFKCLSYICNSSFGPFPSCRIKSVACAVTGVNNVVTQCIVSLNYKWQGYNNIPFPHNYMNSLLSAKKLTNKG